MQNDVLSIWTACVNKKMCLNYSVLAPKGGK